MFEYSFSLADVEILLLIIVRISCFVFVAPFFGTANSPARVKIGLSVFVSLLIYGLVDKTGIAYTGIFGYSIIVIREGITGLLIGLAANICNSIILFAGNIIDMDIGLAMATEFDPTNNTQVTITGNLYQYFILLLLIATDMHHVILRAAVDSFSLIPINGQKFNWDHLLASMATYMGDMFVIAFRIILPVFACIMILNCILGIMAKVSPQMNMFSVGMQMKIMVGFMVLFITITLLPSVADFIFKEMKTMIVSFVKGMY
ncbi:MAG: flagellar biosynthetic protein FliR [Roseburia sp.]|uniref:flagellar biosynthetic protein FliR n=1 Tax=Roseburia sp. 831b TaxID=1261635 RepID=UPI0009516AA1|nr:flagellar biosynthetic protein FliR [Roseburia sp. 831b]MCI5918566.1 flagellar biosynthetic protein FliR [Roseburia sp.]MDD6216532.1 flagellar biosynthetic protein FliR [Roseburia sp.]MDY5883239.1 flagellar biosynthetic protein FliR [Roseburia sp.]WVK73857.1 flagellar biosynthetic protein FliR [Roseburia sp. 831b]